MPFSLDLDNSTNKPRPAVTVAVQNVYYDVPTARLLRESPYWREQVSAHLRQHRELLLFMGGDFDVRKIPAIVLDETRNGLTVTPSDFRAYTELLHDEESARHSPASASASDTNTNDILPWWSPSGPPPPIAHTGSVLARMAHHFGREQLSRDIQNALLQMKQTQYTARRDAGPDYSPVREHQSLLQFEVARRRAAQELVRQAREFKQKMERKEMDIWLYDGGARRVVSGDDSPGHGSDNTSGEDARLGSTFVLPSMLSPLPSHFYRSASSQSPTSSQHTASRVPSFSHAAHPRPLPIMEPRIVLALPPMRLPMSLLSPSSLPSPAVSVLLHSPRKRLVRSAHSLVESTHGRQLVTPRLSARQQPCHQLGCNASLSAPSSLVADVAQTQGAAAQGARPVSSSTNAARTNANTHAAAHRRWNPYRYPDPLAGLGYYMRDRHGRPGGLPSRAHAGVPSRRPYAANKRQGPSAGQSEGQDDSDHEVG